VSVKKANDGVYDHEAILTASDGTNPDGGTNWDLVDAHTNNRYHAYWTLAQCNTSWGDHPDRRTPHSADE
jgi:hypothetical protein